MFGERFFGQKITRRELLVGSGTAALGLFGAALVGCGVKAESTELHRPRKAEFLYPNQSYLGRDQYLAQFDEVFDAARNGLTHDFIRIADEQYLEGECEFESQDGRLFRLKKGEYTTGQKFRYVTTISPPELFSRSNIPGVTKEQTIIHLNFEGLPRINPEFETVKRKWPYGESKTEEVERKHVVPKTLYGFATEFTKAYNWALENGKIKASLDEQSRRQQRSHLDRSADEIAA